MDDRSMKAAAGQSGNEDCGACQMAMKPAEVAHSLSRGLCDACFATLSADGSREDAGRSYKR